MKGSDESVREGEVCKLKLEVVRGKDVKRKGKWRIFAEGR